MGYCIYKHTAPNGKVYIGQTINGDNPNRRWRDGKGYSECTYFCNAIKKYGWDNFKHEIICNGLTAEKANEAERALIKKYNSNNADYGYNLSGGGKNCTLSEETKRKISEAETGDKNHFYGKHHTEEIKEKLRKAHIGKHLSEETKRKMSATTTGNYSKERLRKMSERMLGENNPFYNKHHTKEAKAKMSEFRKGKKMLEETKAKISKSTLGENNHMYGKHRSLELKQKLKETHSKSVLCVETGEVFESALEAQSKTGISNSSISKCCCGKQKTACKLHWKFLNEGDENV